MSDPPVEKITSKRSLEPGGQKREAKRVKLTHYFSVVKHENKAESCAAAVNNAAAHVSPIENKENLVSFANDAGTHSEVDETQSSASKFSHHICIPVHASNSIAEGHDLHATQDLDGTSLLSNVHLMSEYDLRVPNIESLLRKDVTQRKMAVDLTQSNGQVEHLQTFDIGDYLDKPPDDSIKRSLLTNPWIPPKGYKFPFSEHMKQGKPEKRFASHKHLDAFSWLLFSHAKQGYFCKYCSLFVISGLGGFCKNVPLAKLVTQPLNSYAKVMGASGDFLRHSETDYHKNSVAAAIDFLNAMDDPAQSVMNRVSAQRREQVRKNRLHLKSMVENTIFLGQQNIAFRAHRDDGPLNFESDANQGNFKELLKFRINCGDAELGERIKKAPANASYMSKTTQNDLIQCCGEEIIDIIISRIKKARFLSVIFDESTDMSQISQMTLVLRYLHNNIIYEDFIKFVDLFKAAHELKGSEIECTDEMRITGCCIGEIVIQTLKALGLDPENCVAITTDGCSVMISEICGAVSVIKAECKNASYSPCQSHMLNLSISKSSSVRAIRNAVAHMKSTVGFFKASAKRSDSLKKSLGVSLCALCETRWGERHDGVMQFRELLPEIVAIVDRITLWRDTSTSSRAKSLRLSLLEPEFIVSTICLSDVLSCTRPLSLLLQRKNIDVKSVQNLVEGVVTILSNERENFEVEFLSIFEEVQILAMEMNVEITVPRTCSTQTYRDNHPGKNALIYYRRSIYVPLLENIIQDLTSRFSKNTLELYHLFILVPDEKIVENEPALNTSISALVDKYKVFFDMSGSFMSRMLKSELNVWQMKWKREGYDDSKNAIDYLKSCDKEIFPIVHTLLEIFVTLPFTSASAERSFSTLKRIKTWLRTTMSENRLNGLALLHIHHHLDLDIDRIIDRYATMRKRKADFIL